MPMCLFVIWLFSLKMIFLCDQINLPLFRVHPVENEEDAYSPQSLAPCRKAFPLMPRFPAG